MSAKRVRFEMVLVAIEYCAHYPPHVVYPVGIEEAHRAFVLFGRKTAEHQYTCAIGRKGARGCFSVGIFICFNQKGVILYLPTKVIISFAIAAIYLSDIDDEKCFVWRSNLGEFPPHSWIFIQPIFYPFHLQHHETDNPQSQINLSD